MSNIVLLRPSLKAKEQDLDFNSCTDDFRKAFADGTLAPGKWFMFAVTPEGQPMISTNGFQPGEMMFAMEAVKDWLMQ